MTVNDLQERLEEYPSNALLLAFDGDEGEVLPVTGLLYTPGEPPTLEFTTDQP